MSFGRSACLSMTLRLCLARLLWRDGRVPDIALQGDLIGQRAVRIKPLPTATMTGDSAPVLTPIDFDGAPLAVRTMMQPVLGRHSTNR